MKRLSYETLVRVVAARTDEAALRRPIALREVRDVLAALRDVMGDALRDDCSVHLPGLFTVRARTRKARVVKNFAGDRIALPESREFHAKACRGALR